MSAFEVTNLSKTFSGQVVLDRASLTIGEGEIHGLVGQNGSGKSTLIKILAGYHTPDPGASASVYGRPLSLGSATSAHELGLRFVHQDLGLVESLNAVENIMLSRQYPTRMGRIKWREARRATTQILERVGLDIDVRAPVGELGFADRSRLAIARVLPEQADERIMLVLDEPTAALPSKDVDRLFATMRQLQRDGHALMIVSHHLDEILEIADNLTVLRDGKKVSSVATKDVDAEGLTRMIVGFNLDLAGSRAEQSAAHDRPELRIADLSGPSVRSVSFEVHRGEIVGVAGLSGSGRETLASLITGRLAREGLVEVSGRVVPPADPRAALDAGMASVSGERARFGVFPTLNVRHNMTIGDLRPHTRAGRLLHGSEKREIARWIEDLGIVTRGSEAPITSLSGGNQQKVLVARALRLKPAVLVLDDPTAGIDVGARDQVHRIIEGPASDSMAVLVVSTDSTELARICDRVLVMQRGVVVEELRRGSDLTAEAIDHAQVAIGVA